MQSVEILSDLTSVGKATFKSCTELKSVKITGNVEVISNDMFKGCISLEIVELPETTTIIDNNAFRRCLNLKTIKLPDSLEFIYDNTFMISGLEYIEPPSKLELVGIGAFWGCKSLTSVVFTGENTAIYDSCFRNCENLTNVVLPANLDVIPNSAFKCCYELKEIELPQSLTRIGDDAFAMCRSLEEVTIPNGVWSIGGSAFEGCENLKTVRIPLSVSSIEEYVFYNCPNLEYIYIGDYKLKATDDIIDHFDKIYPFLKYTIQNNKFIPKNIEIMTRTHLDEIKNYYAHANSWKEVHDAYVNKWLSGDAKNSFSKGEIEHIIACLYSACVALGLFQDGEMGIEAKEFILEHIVSLSLEDIEDLFENLETRTYGFNKEFAMFFIQNYALATDSHFMDQIDIWEQKQNYIDDAYNNWLKVKEVYPNKTPLRHREHASENNNLLPEDVIRALTVVEYENVDDGNEELAELAGRYGYDQWAFEELQEIWNIAKNIDQEQMVLKIGKDTQAEGVVFEFLAKDNLETLFVGEKTNCC